MSTDFENTNSSTSDDPIADFEGMLVSGDIQGAKASLRSWLFSEFEGEDGSIADAIGLVVKSRPKSPTIPAVVLRSLAVDGVIPEPNSNNQLERLIVELCETGAGEICEFLGLKPKSQNYEKFALLQRAHSGICSLLSVLTDSYGNLHALVGARRLILGRLNHSIVRAYAGPYHIRDFKSATEVLFTSLQKVEVLDAAFLQNFEDCQRTIGEMRALLEQYPSFLSQDYFAKILETAQKCLDQFLADVRSQFRAKVSKGWSSQNSLAKRYPLHEGGREFHLVVPLRNEGAGLALEVTVSVLSSSDAVVFANSSTNLGSVKPGDFSVVLETLVIRECAELEVLIQVEWGEIGNPERMTTDLLLQVFAQSKNIDWPSLEYWSPYSTNVAVGENFIGRNDLVRNLSAKLLRAVMEPFYITGQKRVGKTSLATAITDFATAHAPAGSTSAHYILWGDVANADPAASVRSLGKNIERFIRSALGSNILIEDGDYDGSLSHLVSVSEVSAQVAPEKRFVFVIDEFDEIPQELFLQGNLADTFFANLRSISRRDNFSLILVGGENMPFIMDRQGQKLNNFARVNLSYFSREHEWQDFQEMIRKPTAGVINWHEDAISEVYNVSNGNPYFAKIVCAATVQNAVSERDTDITADEVKTATDTAISALGSNSFAHLWQDGVPRPAAEREPDILRRSRVLVASARCCRNGLPLTAANATLNRVSVSLTENDVVAVLNDFVKRGVLSENKGTYRFVLPIFGQWLMDVGAQQLISDNLSEELANSAIQEENAAVIRSDEVVELSKKWPTYRGQQIGTDDIRAWYQQVESPKDQRVLFTLLKRTKVFSEAHVRERVREAFTILRPTLPVPITRTRNERRTDVVITYVDGEGKSGNGYAALYAEENKISAKNIISQVNFSERYAALVSDSGPISAVVVIDDIAATGESLSGNVSKFTEENISVLSTTKVRVITLAATQEGQKLILSRLAKIVDVDVDFHSCQILGHENLALPPDKSGFGSEVEWERAKSLCVDLGSKIDKRRPLGFGGLGLLVVFPTNAPNNTLPILRSFSKSGSGKPWRPLFERLSH
ncbi:AAA family ATPase [Devosia sp.]|uniref:phosphoribosyltransferase-like protein n=1 Tax=Devosia sp. TaxID=1871048 RepID=UPI00273480D9|nr:AAA family ATPase [Devosia sp.]MDP2782895.1 AAA family ATPase [Devosia sp.]